MILVQAVSLESKLIVIGYEFEEGNSNMEEGLMREMLKEDAEPMGKVKVIWKKHEAENKKSLVILDMGNKWNRDNIMRNQKAGNNFIVTRSIPK